MTDRSAPGDDARFTLAVPATASTTEIVVGAGARTRLPDLVSRHAPAHRYVVIADAAVAGLYGEDIVARLHSAGRRAGLLAFPGGEASKTPATWAALLEEMVAHGVGRDACVIGLGGGVATDLAGFVAATFMRGVAAVHIPTSLLAMIDAAIGGKTGVDLPGGKNLVGAFHHPRLVVADPDTLGTLPASQLRCGLAEAVKHGAIADADYFEATHTALDRVLELDGAALRDLVVGSIGIKIRHVAADAREAGVRAMLNFGHTIGHAVERVTGYRVPHGEAVAMGMVAEARLGELIGVTQAGTSERLARTLRGAGLPTSLLGELDPERVARATASDKKARAGAVRYALIRRIGEAASGPDGWTHTAPEDAVLEALAATARDGVQE